MGTMADVSMNDGTDTRPTSTLRRRPTWNDDVLAGTAAGATSLFFAATIAACACTAPVAAPSPPAPPPFAPPDVAFAPPPPAPLPPAPPLVAFAPPAAAVLPSAAASPSRA